MVIARLHYYFYGTVSIGMMSDDESPDEVIDLAELVLKYARNGNRDKLEQLLDGNAANTELVNCRGNLKTKQLDISFFGTVQV